MNNLLIRDTVYLLTTIVFHRSYRHQDNPRLLHKLTQRSGCQLLCAEVRFAVSQFKMHPVGNKYIMIVSVGLRRPYTRYRKARQG